MTTHSPSDAEERPAAAGRSGRRSARILGSLAALVIGSGVFAFFAIGETGVSTAAGAERLEVSFDEWTLETDSREIPAGRTTLAIENEGVVDHELLILKTDLPAGDLPQGFTGPSPELAGELILGEAHSHESSNDSYALLNKERTEATKDHVLPDEQLAVEVDLDPGSYVLYCNLPGHYNRGQYASLTVTGNSGGTNPNK